MTRQYQRPYLRHAWQVISVPNMDTAEKKRAKPTPADIAAAARLRAIWQRIPRPERPTQEKAAELLGTNQSAISQYVTGRIPLNARAVLTFARLLGCRPEDIRDDLPELQLARGLNAGVREAPARYTVGRYEDTEEARLDAEWHRFSADEKRRILELVQLARGIRTPALPRPQGQPDSAKSRPPGADLRERRRTHRAGKRNVS